MLSGQTSLHMPESSFSSESCAHRTQICEMQAGLQIENTSGRKTKSSLTRAGFVPEIGCSLEKYGNFTHVMLVASFITM